MSAKNIKARIIAFYLPQFHPIPENDLWWGKGFTEWTNVGKAKRLFRRHYQPRIPADLGYYDLRLAEIRKAQADLALEHGIQGFCYWHYWFGNGKRLLERPFNDVLSSGEPDFPFCLSWANHSWYAKNWNNEVKGENKLLQKQEYPGIEDYITHFNTVLPAFKDKRYIRVNDKPLFQIYKPFDFPDTEQFIELWRKLAVENGLSGIYFVGQTTEIGKIEKVLEKGFDAVNVIHLFDYVEVGRGFYTKAIQYIRRKIFNLPFIFEYENAMKYFIGEEDSDIKVIPTIIPNWDHTPRSGLGGTVFNNSTPELFRKHVISVLDKIKEKPQQESIIFIKSWNEWAEGNYMEPDLKYGLGHLKALKTCLDNFNNKIM